jgi:hypothetical protein
MGSGPEILPENERTRLACEWLWEWRCEWGGDGESDGARGGSVRCGRGSRMEGPASRREGVKELSGCGEEDINSSRASKGSSGVISLGSEMLEPIDP